MKLRGALGSVRDGSNYVTPKLLHKLYFFPAFVNLNYTVYLELMQRSRKFVAI
jgi:hypothetical protein